MQYVKRLCLVICMSLIQPNLGIRVFADQDLFIDQAELLEMESRMLYFFDQLHEISVQISQYTPEELKKASLQVTALEAKWNVYYQSKENEIANDDSLLQIVANFQLAEQALRDSIAYREKFFEAHDNFDRAEAFILAQDTVYEELYNKALEYSFVQKLSAQLEQVKGKEQLVFADIQSYYDGAKTVAQEFTDLSARFLSMEEKYIVLKNTSEKIQALEYKPWVQRIKDYLYSFAAVAMILMFLNMLQAKWKAFKQARENAKKYGQLLNKKDEDDYPVI